MNRLLSAIPVLAWAILGAVVAAMLTGTLCWHLGRAAEREDAAARALKTAYEAQQRDAAAKEAAATQRVLDGLKTDALKEDLLDAVKNLPDARPSDRRVALACERLRQQGAAPASLPARCRPAG